MRTQAIVAIALALVACPPPSSAQDAESQVYAAAKTCTGLNAYLRTYPEGRFRADAQSRIAKECAAPSPVPAPTPAPKTASTAKPKPKPAEKPTPPASTAAAAPTTDPCVTARADWAQISASQDTGVLKTFLTAAPAECITQRAQAQARLDVLQAAANEAKRKEWLGVPEFDGVWVLDTSAANLGCGNFPWRYAPSGQYIRRIYGNTDKRDMKVLATSPPTLGVLENNKGRAIIEGQRMRIENKDGKLDCYLKRREKN